jgi:site-specific DNA recombinase
MINAVVYTRFSSDRQREASSEDQARNCRRRIEAEGWQLVEHFKDEGITGSTAERPAYKAMLTAAAAGEFTVLLIDDLSRLSRDQIESERVIRRLEFSGVRIIAVSDGYDSTSRSAARKIQRGVKGLMNEMRLDELREQVHRGLTGQALAKFWCGGRPYGYKLVQVTDAQRVDSYGKPAAIGTRLERNPDQDVIVAEVFSHFADDWSVYAIAAELNRRGVPSPGTAWRNRRVGRASKWVASGIQTLLENELYRGEYCWNKTRRDKEPETNARRVRRRPEAEWIRATMPELRIVSEAVWTRVQARRQRRAAAVGGAIREAIRRGGRGPKYLFSGVLRCGECGSAMVVKGGKANYYGCSANKLGGAHACRNDLTVKRAIIEARLLAPIKTDLLSEEIVAEVERRYRKALERQPTKPDEARLQQLRAEIDNLTDAIAGGALRASPALARRLAAAEQELATLTASAQVKRAPATPLRPRVAERYQQMVRNLETALGKDTNRARAIIRELVGWEIKVVPNETREHLVAQLATGTEALVLKASGGGQTMSVPGIGLEPTTRALRMRCSTN